MQSSWSEAESGVTMEIGDGDSTIPAALASSLGVADDEGHSDAATSPRRCVIPKVQLALNVSDQRVPEYWDQTVPVLPSCKVKDASFKSKAHSSRGNDHGRAVGVGDCHPSVYLRSSPVNTASSEGNEEDIIDNDSSSEVSFDDVMSMYQNSLVEKSHKWSRALRAILNHRSRKRHDHRRRLWRDFAGSYSSAIVNISVLKCSRFWRRNVSGLKLGEVDEYSLRSLEEAIERTSIRDASSSNSESLATDAVYQVWRCDFQSHLKAVVIH